MVTPVIGPARERLGADQLALLQKTGTVILDERRRRSLFFDGRFLAARDLTREQTYFLTRQADLGLAGGAGVVQGLLVDSPAPTALRVAPGQGVTPTGESVVVRSALQIALTDLPEMQRLDAAFGLLQIPREPTRDRSGLYVVALRPVEFTANPIASYPTTLDGPRSLQDGDIIEGAAVTLIPYPGTGGDVGQQRARAALDLFVRGGQTGAPAAVLPLAMVALDRGVVQWVDPYLVRREVGALEGEVLGLGFAPRALRESQLLQYQLHLQDVLRQRNQANRGQRFAASESFFALPPGGPMPAAAIDPTNFTQLYFPPDVAVDLSVIPQDEVPALLEESLRLPPLDLTLSGDELASTSVLVLIPLPRPQVRSLKTSLDSLTRTLLPAAPGLVARRTPLETLRILRPPVPVLPPGSVSPVRPPIPLPPRPVPGPPVNLVDAAWRQALAGKDLLWYVRRRNLPKLGEMIQNSLSLRGDLARDEDDLNASLKTFGLQADFAALTAAAVGVAASAEIVFFLSSPRFAADRTLMGGAIQELKGQAKPDLPFVVGVEGRFADPDLGAGLARLEGADPELKTDAVVKTLTQTGRVPEVDGLGRRVPDTKLADVATQLKTAAKTGNVATLNTTIDANLKAFP